MKKTEKLVGQPSSPRPSPPGEGGTFPASRAGNGGGEEGDIAATGGARGATRPTTVDGGAVESAKRSVERSAKALQAAAASADAAAAQLQLVALDRVPEFEEGLLLDDAAMAKRYTAQHAQQNSMRRDACIYMLARKCPVEDIAQILKMNLRTIEALAALNGGQLAAWSEKYSQDLLSKAGEAIAIAQTKMGGSSYLQLVTGAGILIDKAEKVKALAGQATAEADAIDVTVEDPALKSAREFVERLKSAKAVVDLTAENAKSAEEEKI